jgi:hypothetical protein
METKRNRHRILIASLLLVAIILITVFWLTGKNVNVYQASFVGAIFEIIWLPMILFTFILPLVCIYFWSSERWSYKSPFLYLTIASSLSLNLFLF